MNRELKFRCWEIENKCWANMAYLECCGNELKHLLFHDKPEKYVIQQFTGLKDKNNKDIYEGDIVKEGYCQGRAEIVFTDGGFLSKDLKHSWEEFLQEDVNTYEECRSFLCSSHAEDMEVIGNIFENPELLK